MESVAGRNVIETMAVAAGDPPPARRLPFIVLLLAIVAMPFVSRAWEEGHYPKVAVVLGWVTVEGYSFS